MDCLFLCQAFGDASVKIDRTSFHANFLYNHHESNREWSDCRDTPPKQFTGYVKRTRKDFPRIEGVVYFAPKVKFNFINMHIGAHIKEIFDSGPKKWTVTWFARELNCDRRNVYNIFSRQSIDSELLLRISIILHYNFFSILVKECEDEITNISEREL